MKSVIKKTILSIYNCFPLISKLIGRPTGYFRKTEDWIASESNDAGISRLHKIIPDSHRVRQPPKSLNEEVPWQFDLLYRGKNAEDPSAWVAEIPGGGVVGNGAVVTPDNYLLIDVSRELIQDQTNHSILHRIRFPRVRKVPGRVAVLSVASVNYWHWFFDFLSRVFLMKKYVDDLDTIDAFVVNNITYPYQRETIERLDIPAGKIIEGGLNDLHIKADVLIVPSVFKDIPSKWACTMLRDHLFDQSEIDSKSKRLYLSRDDARFRRVLNEDDLMDKLTPFGFEKVVLTGMSVRQQRDLFRSAEFIVAPHGAGLTNIIFCREGTRVLEIFPPTYVNPCYWALSDNLGLDYYFSIGEGIYPPPPPSGTNAYTWFYSFVNADKDNGRNIRVKIPDILALLKKALHKEN